MKRPCFSAGSGRSFVVSAVFVLLAFAASAQVAPLAGGGHYQVVQDGKELGSAQYSVAPISGGFALRSDGSMKLGSFSYSFQSQATVDSSLNFVHDVVTGAVNGKNVTFTAGSDATGRNISIEITGGANGAQTNTVDRHRNLVLLPDLDPAALTVMTHQALAQPATAWVLIPKDTGLLVPADYRMAADVRGTLGGSPVTVKHMTANVGAENALTLDLFASPDGQLLEADLDEQNLQVVRDGFKLTERPKPAVPATAAPPAEQGQQGYGAPQGYGQPGQAPQPPQPAQPGQAPQPPQP